MKQYKYKINGNNYNVTVNDPEGNIAVVEVNGTSYKVEMEIKEKPQKTAIRPVTPTPKPTTTITPKPATLAKMSVKSPLPGLILDVKVNVGDSIKKGQVVVILEAMKMENNINTTQDGIVKAINVSKGESVLEGADLIIIE